MEVQATTKMDSGSFSSSKLAKPNSSTPEPGEKKPKIGLSFCHGCDIIYGDVNYMVFPCGHTACLICVKRNHNCRRCVHGQPDELKCGVHNVCIDYFCLDCSVPLCRQCLNGDQLYNHSKVSWRFAIFPNADCEVWTMKEVLDYTRRTFLGKKIYEEEKLVRAKGNCQKLLDDLEKYRSVYAFMQGPTFSNLPSDVQVTIEETEAALKTGKELIVEIHEYVIKLKEITRDIVFSLGFNELVTQSRKTASLLRGCIYFDKRKLQLEGTWKSLQKGK